MNSDRFDEPRVIGWTYCTLGIGGIFCYIYIQKALLVLIALIVLLVDGTFYFIAHCASSRQQNDDAFGGGAHTGQGDDYEYDDGPNHNPFASENHSGGLYV